MARELSPIKVKIGLDANGHALYPNFNSMTVVQEAGMDWSKYIDVHGTGWHYDKISGHQDDDVDSPQGEQWAMLMIPKAFGDDALTKFPEQCFALTEVEAKAFYDDRVTVDQMDEDIDSEVLNGIKLKQDLGGVLTQDQNDALDPLKRKPGIKKNDNRYFDDLKAKKGLTLVESVAIPIIDEEPPVIAKK